MQNLDKQHLSIVVNEVLLEADLMLPLNASAIIIIGNIPGNKCMNHQNKVVAHHLVTRGFGTLQIDLLTPEEVRLTDYQFDINLLAFRLVRSTERLEDMMEKAYPLGYFASGRVATAALSAATALQQVKAIVSISGASELARDSLSELQAATLLLVESLDLKGVAINQEAFSLLKGQKSLQVIQGTACMFDDKTTSDQLCTLTGDWFEDNLKPVKLFDTLYSIALSENNES